MAQEIIQKNEHAPVNDMKSKDILNVDPCLVKIRQFKLLLQERESEGLAELISLLEEIQVEWVKAEQFDEVTIENKVFLLDEILVLAEQHLDQPLENELLDDLLFGVKEFCQSDLVSEQDLATLKEILCQDDSTSVDEAVIVGDSVDHDQMLSKMKGYKNQFNQFVELAETKELMAIQEILLAFNEWFESDIEEHSVDELNFDHHVVNLDKLTTAITSYLNGDSGETVINDFIDGIRQLSDEIIIPSEAIDDFYQMLRAEIIQNDSHQSDVESVSQQQNDETEVIENGIEDQESAQLVPEHLKEFLSLLQMAIGDVEIKMAEMLKQISHISADQNFEAYEDFEVELHKFTGVVALAGFEGLKLSCEHAQDNYIKLKENKFIASEEGGRIWNDWIEATVNYLQSPLDPELIQQLLIVHCSPEWSSALNEAKTTELLINLRELGADKSVFEAPQRQVEVLEGDVSLQIPDDVYPELLEGLLQELPLLTEGFSQAVGYLSRRGRMDDLITAQRVAHTIKGAGNTVGIKGVANLTHHLEDILTALSNAQVLPNKIIISTLLRASDCLEEMSEALAGNGSEPDDAIEVFQEILNLGNRIDHEGVEFEANEVPETAQDKATILETAPTKKKVEAQVENKEESTEQVVRVPVSVVDKLMEFSNETMIVNGQLREKLRQTTEKTRLMQNQLDLIYGLGLELEELVDVRNYNLMKGGGGSGVNNNFDSVENDFDSLEMDQYNELHTCSRRITEVSTDIREMGGEYRKELTDIDNMLIEQDHLNSFSQGDLLSMRLVSVKSVLPRIQRSVRQACRMTGKNVELEIIGSDVLIDRDILNGVVDPLMHVLRNAVDHGIESEENRIAMGKEAGGSIHLSFGIVGNQVEIQCRDDGAGLNLDLIRAKGIERGIIESDAEIDEDELKMLIFQPNFSTSESVSQVSGRGVGMEAVSNGVRSLGGALKIDSEVGQGCVFNISLPLSLVHYHSLLVKIGSQSIALAERSIEQILHSGAGKLEYDKDNINFIFEDDVYPVKTLDSLLTGVVANNSIPLDERTIILVQHQKTQYAVLVEKILGVSELVVKDLGGFVPNIHGVIGASILDDGSVASVLDVQELLDDSKHWSQLDLNKIGEDRHSDQLCALVVDDSLSARRSLEQFVGDLGFNIMAARDGQEAIEMIYKRLPDIVITDMEMPRINGIELTEFIRANPDTSQKHIPVIMITSRSTTKHKIIAESKGVDVYLTKPYSEEELTNHVLGLVDNTEQPQHAMAV